MKRFLIFDFDQYYPCGGMNDLIASVDNDKDVDGVTFLLLCMRKGIQILDLNSGTYEDIKFDDYLLDKGNDIDVKNQIKQFIREKVQIIKNKT